MEALQPAIAYELWCVEANYTLATRPLYRSLCPFPLPFVVLGEMRTAAQTLARHAAGQSPLGPDGGEPADTGDEPSDAVANGLYDRAEDCLDALLQQLSASASAYLLGAQPCSADAGAAACGVVAACGVGLMRAARAACPPQLPSAAWPSSRPWHRCGSTDCAICSKRAPPSWPTARRFTTV